VAGRQRAELARARGPLTRIGFAPEMIAPGRDHAAHEMFVIARTVVWPSFVR
jgi:hypothetical protein